MKRWIALLSAVALLVCSLPMMTFAQSEPLENQYDKVYYTDLFFGYETHDYFYSDEYAQYIQKNETTVNRIFNEFMDSPGFFWTQIKTSVNAACDLREWFQLISDGYGSTDYNYDSALDAANVLFVQHLFDRSDTYDSFGMMSEGYEAVSDFYEGYDTFLKEAQAGGATGAQLIEKAFGYLKSSPVFSSISDYQLTQIQQELTARTDTLSDVFSAAGDIMGAVEAISIALMMEQMRIQMIDNILKYATSDMTLYDGMIRLRTQLRDGFASYFIDNYLRKEILDKLVDASIELMGGGLYAAVSGVVSAASYVVFDLLFDVAGMDDVLLQTTLRDYTVNFAQILKNQRLKFDSEAVTGTEIYFFEYNFAGYLAATDAALEASEALALDSNRYLINETRFACQGFNYSTYILKIIDRLEATPNGERKLKSKRVLGTYMVSELCQPTDEPNGEEVYLFKNTLYGNLTILYNGHLVIPSGEQYVITGDLCTEEAYATGSKLTIQGGATLEVEGSVQVRPYGMATIEETAQLIVNGDLIGGSIYNNGNILLKGNYTGSSTFGQNSKIIFGGTAQQTVTRLKAYAVEVLNPAGIRYLSDTEIYGVYNLHGNPLDDGGYQTVLYDGATLVDGSDYEDLTIVGNIALNFSSKGTICIAHNGRLTVPTGETHKVTGDIILDNAYATGGKMIMEDGAMLEVDGTVQVTVYASLTINETAQLIVNGDLIGGSIYNNGNILLKGNYTGSSTFGQNSKIVFDGTAQQTVTRLKAYAVEVLNPAGIRYLSNAEIYGVYNLHGNPLDDGGYQTVLYDGASLVGGSDYEDLTVYGNMPLNCSIKGNLTIMNYQAQVTVPTGEMHVITGDIYAGDSSRVVIEAGATLVVDGNIRVDSYASLTIEETARLVVNGDLIGGSIYNNGNILLKGNYTGSSTFGQNSKIVFDGTARQTVQQLRAATVVLKNESEEGVVFTSAMTASKLFDHNGNAFTLYNNGVGSSFVDHDGDGALDHLDDDPTAAYMCLLSEALSVKSDVLTGMTGGITAAELYTMVSSAYTVTVYDGETVSAPDAAVTTGHTLVVSGENGVYAAYTLAVDGDANGDGKANTSDARAILVALASADNTLSTAQVIAADADDDGVLTTWDVRAWLLSLLQKER